MTAREYLFSLEQIGIKLGLEQIRLLLLALDCPDLAFPSIDPTRAPMAKARSRR